MALEDWSKEAHKNTREFITKDAGYAVPIKKHIGHIYQSVQLYCCMPGIKPTLTPFLV
jgi:hypothetical protein